MPSVAAQGDPRVVAQLGRQLHGGRRRDVVEAAVADPLRAGPDGRPGERQVELRWRGRAPGMDWTNCYMRGCFEGSPRCAEARRTADCGHAAPPPARRRPRPPARRLGARDHRRRRSRRRPAGHDAGRMRTTRWRSSATRPGRCWCARAAAPLAAGAELPGARRPRRRALPRRDRARRRHRRPATTRHAVDAEGFPDLLPATRRGRRRRRRAAPPGESAAELLGGQGADIAHRRAGGGHAHRRARRTTRSRRARCPRRARRRRRRRRAHRRRRPRRARAAAPAPTAPSTPTPPPTP